MNTFKNIKIILCDTTHQGNIGATARAMKTMGFYNLVLVSPKAKPDDHAIALATNARDVIENAQIVDKLETAIQDCHITIAMTSRKREFSHQLFTPKEISTKIYTALNSQNKIAIVFGNEAKGLTIEQQELCNHLVTIPGNPEYFSLNLSQAVQIICYELYSSYSPDIKFLQNIPNLATSADLQELLNKIDMVLNKYDAYNNKNKNLTQRRVQNILHKANLEKNEVAMIHGFIKKIIEKQVDKNK